MGEAQRVGEASSDYRLRPTDSQTDGEPSGFQPHVALESNSFDVVNRGNLVRFGEQRSEAPACGTREHVCRAAVPTHHRLDGREEAVRGGQANHGRQRVQAVDLGDHKCQRAAIAGQALLLAAEGLLPSPAVGKASRRSEECLRVVKIFGLKPAAAGECSNRRVGPRLVVGREFPAPRPPGRTAGVG